MTNIDFKLLRKTHADRLSNFFSLLTPFVRGSPRPPRGIQTHHPDYLIRLYLRYGKSAEALDQTLKLVRKVRVYVYFTSAA